MGLWPWLFGHMFTPRFWKSVKTDGYLLTWTRGHKAVMNTHSVGGNTQKAKLRGMDQYGNKYYEDYDAVYTTQQRWVEFNNYFSVRSPNGDRIPPKWHGWLSHQYDDIPAPDGDHFHDPFFQKKHDWTPSHSAFKMYTSKQSLIHPQALEFRKYRKDRYSKQWQPVTKRE